MYDITKEQSFLSVKKWMEEVKEHAEPDIVIMLVGNKLDICEKQPSERKVSYERAEEFANQNGLHFRETSAYTDHNVRDVFEVLVQEIYNVKSQEDINARRAQGGRRLVHNDPNMEGEKKFCQCL